MKFSKNEVKSSTEKNNIYSNEKHKLSMHLYPILTLQAQFFNSDHFHGFLKRSGTQNLTFFLSTPSKNTTLVKIN